MYDIIMHDPIVCSPIPPNVFERMISWLDQDKYSPIDRHDHDASISISFRGGQKRFWISSSTLKILSCLNFYFQLLNDMRSFDSDLQTSVKKVCCVPMLSAIVSGYTQAISNEGLLKNGTLKYMTAKKLCLMYRTVEFYEFVCRSHPAILQMPTDVFDSAKRLREDLIDRLLLLYNDRLGHYFRAMKAALEPERGSISSARSEMSNPGPVPRPTHYLDALDVLLKEVRLFRELLLVYLCDSDHHPTVEAVCLKMSNLLLGFVLNFVVSHPDSQKAILDTLAAANISLEIIDLAKLTSRLLTAS
jgi:hypothetical protein